MNRILTIFLALISIPTILLATPLEGPTMPGAKKWRIGWQTNVVKDQDIEEVRGSTESTCHFLNLSYSLNKYFCLDGKLGVGDVDYDRDIGEELKFHTGFAGGYGLRLKLYDEDKQEDNIKFIVGLHHICVHPHSMGDSEGKEQKLIWDDWQIDGLMFKEFGSFIPYVGAKIKKVYLVRWIAGNDDDVRMKSKTEFGGAVGFDYKFSENVVVNAETRFIDEEAYTVGLSYYF